KEIDPALHRVDEEAYRDIVYLMRNRIVCIFLMDILLDGFVDNWRDGVSAGDVDGHRVCGQGREIGNDLVVVPRAQRRAHEDVRRQVEQLCRVHGRVLDLQVNDGAELYPQAVDAGVHA